MDNKAAIQAHFDQLAPTWKNDMTAYETRETFVEMMDLPPGSVIADIGCGKGVMEAHLLKSDPAKIIAIDLSPEMIRGARELYTDPRIEFVAGDLYEIELPPLDLALIYNAYPHFMDKAALCDKLADVVKPGGKLVICHSRSREVINGRHSGDSTSVVSVPLREAAQEAVVFAPHFESDIVVDSSEFYFIRMIRSDL